MESITLAEIGNELPRQCCMRLSVWQVDPQVDQRLRAITDNLGNRIEYTLDNTGNRTAEVVKDPAGTLRWDAQVGRSGGTLRRQVSRVPDALGRTQQTTGRE